MILRYRSRVMTARSSLECRLYIELHPCSCGETRVPDQHRLVAGPDGLAAVYDGPCTRCGAARSFQFLLADDIVPLDSFGGATPSSIIDAAQFLAVADAAARATPPDSQLMTRAVAALEEVVKLVPPGADRVPAESIHSVDGRAVYDREPGRFRKARLEAVLGVYQRILAELTAH
jgi:hypothetical protein